MDNLQFVDHESSGGGSSSPMALLPAHFTESPSANTVLDTYGRTALQKTLAFVLSPDTTWKHIAGAVAAFILFTAFVSYLMSQLMPLLIIGAIAVILFFFFKR